MRATEYIDWKRKYLNGSKIYLVLDGDICRSADRMLHIAKKAAESGVDIIQLRAKNLSARDFISVASKLKRHLLKYRLPLIVNDRLDIARISGADGIHLGQDDIPIALAQRLIGKHAIIGISCHSQAQSFRAQREGADYISIGPIFFTPTKPAYRPVGLGLLRRINVKITIPFFAIGGINLLNLKSVLDAGASRIAVVREICQARNIPDKISELKHAFRNR